MNTKDAPYGAGNLSDAYNMDVVLADTPGLELDIMPPEKCLSWLDGIILGIEESLLPSLKRTPKEVTTPRNLTERDWELMHKTWRIKVLTYLGYSSKFAENLAEKEWSDISPGLAVKGEWAKGTLPLGARAKQLTMPLKSQGTIGDKKYPCEGCAHERAPNRCNLVSYTCINSATMGTGTPHYVKKKGAKLSEEEERALICSTFI